MSDPIPIGGVPVQLNEPKYDNALKEFCISVQGCVVDLSKDTTRRLYFQSDVVAQGRRCRMFLLSDLLLIAQINKSTAPKSSSGSSGGSAVSNVKPYKLLHFAPLFNVTAVQSSLKDDRIVVKGLSIEDIDVEVVASSAPYNSVSWLEAINEGSAMIRRKQGQGSVSAIRACLLLYQHNVLSFLEFIICGKKKAPKNAEAAEMVRKARVAEEDRLADKLRVWTLAFTMSVYDWHVLNDNSLTPHATATRPQSNGHEERCREATEGLHSAVTMYACETRDRYDALNKVMKATVKMADHLETDILGGPLDVDNHNFLFDTDGANSRLFDTFSRRGSAHSDNTFFSANMVPAMLSHESGTNSEAQLCTNSNSSDSPKRHSATAQTLGVGCHSTGQVRKKNQMVQAIGRVRGRKVLDENRLSISASDGINEISDDDRVKIATNDDSDCSYASADDDNGSETESNEKKDSIKDLANRMRRLSQNATGAFAPTKPSQSHLRQQLDLEAPNEANEGESTADSLTVPGPPFANGSKSLERGSNTGGKVKANRRFSGFLSVFDYSGERGKGLPETNNNVLCTQSADVVYSGQKKNKRHYNSVGDAHSSLAAVHSENDIYKRRTSELITGRKNRLDQNIADAEKRRDGPKLGSESAELPRKHGLETAFTDVISRMNNNNGLGNSSGEEKDSGVSESVVATKPGHVRSRSLLTFDKFVETLNPASRAYKTAPSTRDMIDSTECMDDLPHMCKVAPKEMSAQLCVRDVLMLGRIGVSEFQDCVWSKRDKKYESAPNISAAIEESNKLAMTVPTEILSYNTPGARARCMERFIQIASSLHKENNFNSLKMVLCGLSCQAVFRLRQSWTLVQDKASKKFEQLQNIMSEEHNYQLYRETLRKAAYPKVPYLGVYLTDITMTSDALRNAAEEKHLALAQLIQQFRNTVSLSKYNYPINTEIDEMLNEKYVMADEEAYQLSLKCEPPATKSSVNNGHRAPREVNSDNLCGRRFNSNDYKELSESTLKNELARLTDEVGRLNMLLLDKTNTQLIPEADIWDIHRHMTYIERQIKILAKKKNSNTCNTDEQSLPENFAKETTKSSKVKHDESISERKTEYTKRTSVQCDMGE